MPYISYIPLSETNFTVGSWAVQSSSGSSLPGNKVTFVDPSKVTSIEINDDDPIFEDDDVGDGWNDNGAAQTLASDTILNGHMIASGTPVEAEYEITLRYIGTDGIVQTFKILSVKVNSSIVGFTFIGSLPPFGVQLDIVSNRDSSFNGDGTYNPVGVPYDDIVPCFAKGTLIATTTGQVAVEDLALGDLILTMDHGPQPIRWIGNRKIDLSRPAAATLRPIRIKAGALGAGSPTRDLIVSPQHRILVRSKIAQRMFGAVEVLVAAKQLLQLEGIDIAHDMNEVDYFHILFDQHQIIISDGAETESLYTGPEALKSVGQAACEEIFAIFPELKEEDYKPTAARQILSGRSARKLAVRHRQNFRALVS